MCPHGFLKSGFSYNSSAICDDFHCFCSDQCLMLGVDGDTVPPRSLLLLPTANSGKAQSHI